MALVEEHQYWDYTKEKELFCADSFETAKYSMQRSDNFSSVKRLIGRRETERKDQVMGGFFVIDGHILDPCLEKTSFETLQVDDSCEILLVLWAENQNEFDDDMWEQYNSWKKQFHSWDI